MLRLAEPLAAFGRIKAGRPQITGIVERYRKTMLDAFHRIAFREKCHATIAEQRKDLDVWTKGKQSRGGDPGPRNWTMRRRPESSLRTSPCDSPAGFALAASINNTQYADYYS